LNTREILAWENESFLIRGKRKSKSDRRKKSAVLKARKRKERKWMLPLGPFFLIALIGGQMY
jgi:hypothetical protein